ncbi:hypothetical protein DFH09DRAFT_869659, partial [Mycena vulgaris]
VSRDLFAYLASYSGIERLRLRSPGSRKEDEHLVDVLFATVLPRHTTSLVKFSCRASYETRWSFGAHDVGAISQLRRLMGFEMSVN